MKRLVSQSQGTPRGFTIVEVLIAVGILAGLTALMWTSISSMYATRDIVEERAQRYQAVRITMDRMSREIASAFLAAPEFGGEPIPGEEEEVTEETTSSRFEPVRFGMVAEDDNIHFTGFAHQRTVEGERAGVGAEIGYFLRTERDDEGNSIQVLMRRTDVSFDPKIERGGVLQRVLENVDSLELRYWDPGPTELGTLEEVAQGRWVDMWDTSRREFAGRLPTRVQITLKMPPLGPLRNPQVFVTETQIGMSEILEY